MAISALVVMKERSSGEGMNDLTLCYNVNDPFQFVLQRH